MRKNLFNETYAHDADELQAAITAVEASLTASSLNAVLCFDPDTISMNYAAEIKENVLGDTVCWCEAGTKAEVEAMLKAVGITAIDDRTTIEDGKQAMDTEGPAFPSGDPENP